MSKYAERIMGILIILMAAFVILLLSKEMEGISLTDTCAVDISRAVIAPILAVIAGAFAFFYRNYTFK